MTKVRYAIIGCGGIAAKHALAIRETPDAELVACCDQVRDSALRFAEANKLHAFDTYEELLASDTVDAVSLCTPSGLHAQQALQALHAGKHVVVEKPLALTLADADAVIEAAQRNGR